jgi:hypothetical protein
LACKCEMRHEGAELRLTADCRGCKEGKADLEDQTCFSGILGAWGTGISPDSIVLSGIVEKQYSGKTLEVFSRMSVMLVEIDRLSCRRPPTDDKEQAKRCTKCNLAPAMVFSDLGPRLGKDMIGFYKEYRERAVRVSDSQFNDTVCSKCLNMTKDDMGFVVDRFEEFLRFVIKEGFKIVL